MALNIHEKGFTVSKTICQFAKSEKSGTAERVGLGGL